MSDRKALEALLKKVEAAWFDATETRAHRFNDFWKLAELALGDTHGIPGMAWDAYKAHSIDAAVALLKAVLPGWTWEVTGEGVATLYRPYGDEWDYNGDAEVQENPARALLLAIIKAKLEECDDE